MAATDPGDTQDTLIFEPLKEHRGWYFVEYHPLYTSTPLVHVGLTILEPRPPEEIASAMEREIDVWVERYVMPVMVFSSDLASDTVRLSGTRASDHVLGWKGSVGIEKRWQTTSSEFPLLRLDESELLRVFHDIPFRRIGKAHREQARARQRRLTIGATVIAMGTVVVPAAAELLYSVGPSWIGRLALYYALILAYIKFLKVLGKWPKSAADVAKAAEESAMRHHHYHCERNPEGFNRLKAENFAREQREATLKEAEELRTRQP